VQAVDAAGNVSDWSETRTLGLVAGITGIITPETSLEGSTPVATEVIVEPTAVPTDVVPTGVPSATPTSVPVPVLLPVFETFDLGTGWLAQGYWRFDTQSAYHGGGWLADSTVRDQSSTLTGDVWIDLRMAVNPQIVFWQRAVLSGQDVIALDLSVDGGLSWLPLDQQIGSSFDWTSRTVDLAVYRGTVIRLRFRLETPGALPEGVTSTGWWIDELTVQEAPVVLPTVTPVPTDLPTAIPTAVPTEPPTATPLPTEPPTVTPVPTDLPTAIPTDVPTEEPAQPTAESGG
jgi:cell division septation protein DedD